MAQSSKGGDIDENLVRHMVLDNLRRYKKKYEGKYGEMIICTDSRMNWRKQVFPRYKETRERQKSKSKKDWILINSILIKVKEEIRQYMPYYVVESMGAEADDVIAILAQKFCEDDESTIIISGDKDFRQLQYYPCLKQYSPHHKAELTEPAPGLFLKEHIIRGDRSDGIPNIMSPINALADEGMRQKSVMTVKVNQWVHEEPEDFCDAAMLRRYYQNQKLIDLRMIPKVMKKRIMDDFSQNEKNGRNKIYSYFVRSKLAELLTSIGDF